MLMQSKIAIIRLSRLRELVEELTQIPSSLVSYSLIAEDGEELSGYVIVASHVYSSRQKALTINQDDEYAKLKLLRNVLCVIPQDRIGKARTIKHGFIVVKSLDNGFLRINGSALLSKDAIVSKYSELLEETEIVK